MELCLVCSDNEMVESNIVRERNKTNRRIVTLDFRKIRLMSDQHISLLQ